MAGTPMQKQVRKLGDLWVEQLYNTLNDVQTQRVGIFFATGMLFGNALFGIRGMVSLCDNARSSEAVR